MSSHPPKCHCFTISVRGSSAAQPLLAVIYSGEHPIAHFHWDPLLWLQADLFAWFSPPIPTILWRSCCFVFSELLLPKLWKQKSGSGNANPHLLPANFSRCLIEEQRLFLCTECHVCIYPMEASGTPELRRLCSSHPSHIGTNQWISFHPVLSKTLPARRHSQEFLGRN